MTMDVKIGTFHVDNGICFKPIYGNIQSYVSRLNNQNQPAAIIDLSVQNQVLNGDFPFCTSDTYVSTGSTTGYMASANPANISNYAWQYNAFYDSILQNTSGEDQTKLLNKLDETFTDLANQQADQLSKNFSGFFNYQQRIYTKYLGEDTDKIFDDNEFKNYLVGLFKGAVQTAISSNDPENAIKNYLAQASADGTPEHMSFNDIYTLNKEYFCNMPTLDNSVIVTSGFTAPFLYKSLDDLEARGNQVTLKIHNSNVLSPQTQKLIEQVSAQKFKLFEKVYAYEDKQTMLTKKLDSLNNEYQMKKSDYDATEQKINSASNLTDKEQQQLNEYLDVLSAKLDVLGKQIKESKEQSESYQKPFLDDLKKDKENYSQFLKNLTA